MTLTNDHIQDFGGARNVADKVPELASELSTTGVDDLLYVHFLGAAKALVDLRAQFAEREPAPAHTINQRPRNPLSLNQDIMSAIFLLLPLDSLVRCMPVCRYWNDIIRNTSALWVELWDDEDRVISQNAVETYLGRAGKNALRKVELGPRTTQRLNSGRTMEIMIENGVANLQYLDLTGWPISMGDTILLLRKASNSLRKLRICHTELAYDVWLTAIQECEALETVECLECTVDFTIHSSLPVRRSMKCLQFQGKLVEERNILSHLEIYPNLEELCLQFPVVTSPPYLYEYLFDLPHIRKLTVIITGRTDYYRLHDGPGATIEAGTLDKVTTNVSNLEHLSFESSSLTGACDVQLVAVLNGCFTRLSVLEITVSNISDVTMRHIAGLTLPNLHTVKISRCHNVTLTGLIPAVKACPKLRDAEFSYLAATTNTLLSCLGECKHLETLTFSIFRVHSSSVSGQGLRSLLTKSKSLRKLCFLDYLCFDLETIEFAYSVLGPINCTFPQPRR